MLNGGRERPSARTSACDASAREPPPPALPMLSPSMPRDVLPRTVAGVLGAVETLAGRQIRTRHSGHGCPSPPCCIGMVVWSPSPTTVTGNESRVGK